MAILGKEKYSPEKIEKLAEYVRLYAERGQPVEYEILVDGFKAVRRTDDPEMFNMFENFVSASTKVVEILFYIRNSNSNDKYMFTFKEDPNETLSGVEIENRITDHVNKAKKDWEHDQIRKENQEQKDYIEELEEENDKLEKEIIEFKARQSPLTATLGEFGASLVESFVKRNPKILNALPGGGTLSGMMEGEDKGEKSETESEAKVIIKSKSSSAHSQDAERAFILVSSMKKSFPGEKFDQLMQIIDRLALDIEKVETVLELLNEK